LAFLNLYIFLMLELPEQSRILFYGAADNALSVEMISRLVASGNHVIIFSGNAAAESGLVSRFPGSVTAVNRTHGEHQVDIRNLLSLIEECGTIDELVMMLDLPVPPDNDPENFLSIIETAVKVGSLEYLHFLYLVLPYVRKQARCSLVVNCFSDRILERIPFSCGYSQQDRRTLVRATASMIREKQIRLHGVSETREMSTPSDDGGLEWKSLGAFSLGLSGLIPASSQKAAAA